MAILIAAFPSVLAASEALAALRCAQVPFTRTSVLGDEASLRPSVVDSAGSVVATTSAGAVGVGMLATGAALFAVGPLAIALTGLGIGSLAGGFLSALLGAGAAEQSVEVAEDTLVQGGVVLLLEVADADEPRARSLLRDVGALPDADGTFRDTLPDAMTDKYPTLRSEAQ